VLEIGGALVQAVVQLSDQLVGQMSQGRFVTVSGGAAAVVVGAGAGAWRSAR
jgi:hypothetical protein